jgi:hypothetical protein
MYYSYVEIEYIATSFSPARTDLALKLLRKQNPYVEEVCLILKKNPNCMHTMDYKFIVPPKESKDKRFIPCTKQNDLSKYTSWKQTSIVASGEDIGEGKNAPMIADTKATILSIGGVLDDDVEIWRLPQFVMNRYVGHINKNYIYLILSTGENVITCTESNNTVSMFTRGTEKNSNNHCIIPKDVFQTEKQYRNSNQSIINYFSFCEEKNRKWIGKMGVDHMNRDRGDNRKVNLRLVWPDENDLNRLL